MSAKPPPPNTPAAANAKPEAGTPATPAPASPASAGTATAPAAAPTPMLVEQVMVTNVRSISSEMTVRQAIQELLKNSISGAPVIDSQKKVLTVVSEGDLLKLAASMGLEKTIYQCMLKLTKTDKLITAKRTDKFTDLYRKFLSNSVHRLIVVDEKGRLEGLVSRSNVLRALVDPANPLNPTGPSKT